MPLRPEELQTAGSRYGVEGEYDETSKVEVAY
jgi:hypothetical protein